MKSARRLLQSALKQFGYRLVREEFYGNYGLIPFFRSIKRLGFAPSHVIDVGANHGEWTRTAIEFFPDAVYTLIEPQERLRKHISDLLADGYKIHWINAGVADVAGRLPLAIFDRDDSCTFAFNPNGPQIPERVLVDVKTLNEIVASSGAPFPEMVKIDAEGFDLKVLTGASDLVGKTEIFLIEACVYGESENSLVEILHRMRGYDYRLVDITDLNHSPKFGNLCLCELAFVSNKSSLLTQITSYE